MDSPDRISWPLVSVVIPSYNCGKFIGDAIDSVLAQGYPALEILVIDDGSTDDTCNVVEGYGRLVTLIRQTNAGSAAARNEGIRRAAGKYIAFLDADDIWLPGKLAFQIDHMEQHPDVQLCCTKWLVLQPSSAGVYQLPVVSAPSKVSLDREYSGWLYCKLLLDVEVCTITVVMTRALAQQVGPFDQLLRRGQDYDYWLRASRVTRIDRIDAPFAVYRMDESALPRKFPNTNWGLVVLSKAIEKWGLVGPDGCALPQGKIRIRLWQLNYDFGYVQYRSKRFQAAYTAFAAAFRHRPLHLKTLLYLVFAGLHSRLNASRES